MWTYACILSSAWMHSSSWGRFGVACWSLVAAVVGALTLVVAAPSASRPPSSERSRARLPCRSRSTRRGTTADEWPHLDKSLVPILLERAARKFVERQRQGIVDDTCLSVTGCSVFGPSVLLSICPGNRDAETRSAACWIITAVCRT